MNSSPNYAKLFQQASQPIDELDLANEAYNPANRGRRKRRKKGCGRSIANGYQNTSIKLTREFRAKIKQLQLEYELETGIALEYSELAELALFQVLHQSSKNKGGIVGTISRLLKLKKDSSL